MDFRARIRRNRRLFDLESRGRWWRRYLSAAEYQVEHAVVQSLRTVAKGRLLDAGCGSMPYRSVVAGQVDEYVALDMERRIPGVDIIADLQSMPRVDSGSFDTVLCTEVLEHLPIPALAMGELARVMVPGGALILTTPHLSRIHEAPHDYHRFTRFGLIELARSADLDVVEVNEIGSIFSLIAHQISTALVVSVWHVRILRWIVLALVTFVVTIPALALDHLPGLRQMLPLNHLLIARRPLG